MLLLVFAVALLAAVLLSCKARESVLSVSVLFLLVGFGVGKGIFGGEVPNRDLLYVVSELALFSVLFADGMDTGGVKNIRREWHLVGRTLAFGMPLTIAGIALVAHWLLAMSWAVSFLIGSVLSPTDPVFVSGLFRFKAVPERIKRILNLESGMNDGLALPAVLICLSAVSRRSESIGKMVWDMALGVAIGVVIPWIAIKLEASRFFAAAGIFQRLNAFAIGLVVLAVALATNANLFLAAFASGITVVSVSKTVRDAFKDFGETVTELLKLAAVLIFGARSASVVLGPLHWQEYVFAAIALFAIRMVAIELSFLGTGMPRREVLTIGWFGPKGFSSVVYALLVLHVQSAVTFRAARVCALVITASILLYSSTDILVGRRFESLAKQKEKQPTDETTRKNQAA